MRPGVQVAAGGTPHFGFRGPERWTSFRSAVLASSGRSWPPTRGHTSPARDELEPHGRSRASNGRVGASEGLQTCRCPPGVPPVARSAAHGWGGGATAWQWTSMPEGSGIVAIRSRSTGKSYFLGVSNIRQRCYDHYRLLNTGRHHNSYLQAAWTADPGSFEFVVVEPVRERRLLPAFKQVWMARTTNTFNRRDSLPVLR